MAGYGSSFVGLIALACAIWVIYDVWKINKKLDKGMKILWTVLAIFFNIITAVVYAIIYKAK